MRKSLLFSLPIIFVLASLTSAHAHEEKRVNVPAAQGVDQIAAIVNGQLITVQDVDDRTKLFAISTGLPMSEAIIERIRSPILHQLIIEKLKTQEILRRHINISPEQIDASITSIEERNGMPKNALRKELNRQGVSITTLIDQIRAQVGWMIVLRQELGPQSRVTPTQITERENALGQDVGKAQYLLSEIFIHSDERNGNSKALALTETIIKELRKGAPFPIVAAQFSQDQSALNGGAIGWVQEDHLTPNEIDIVRHMPLDAISNPIPVPGGYIVLNVHQRRTVGREMGTLVTLRQAFYPFSEPLNPQAGPTPLQQATLKQALKATHHLQNCADVEALNRDLGNRKPSNPGTQLLERLPPPMQSLLNKLKVHVPSQPMVAPDGIDILMVCKRETRNLAQMTPGQIADQLMNEKIEQAARQLQRSLERHAVIQMEDDIETRHPADVDDRSRLPAPVAGDTSFIHHDNKGKTKVKELKAK